VKLLVGAVIGAVALTACVPEPPEVAETPQPAQGAALIDAQVDSIVADTFAELHAADEARDAAARELRGGGDAAVVRAAEYKMAGVTDGPELTELPDSMQAIYVSGAETWPRVLVAVTEQPEDQQTPVVMVWVQADIHTPYQLQGWAHMIPGATMPA